MLDHLALGRWVVLNPRASIQCWPIGAATETALKEKKARIEDAIAENAGAEGSVVVEAVKREGKGFNAETLTYEDLAKNGVVYPTKVVRQALQNAASISGLLLTTEAIVAELPQEEEDQGHGHHHH